MHRFLKEKTIHVYLKINIFNRFADEVNGKQYKNIKSIVNY